MYGSVHLNTDIVPPQALLYPSGRPLLAFSPPHSFLSSWSPVASFSTMFCSQLITLALCTISALAAPSPLLRIFKADNPLPGRFIVTLKQEQGTSSADSVNTFSTDALSTSNITHKWESMGAFAGEISDDDLETLRVDPRVAAIEQDGIMKASATVTQFVPSPRYHCLVLTSGNRLGTTPLGA